MNHNGNGRQLETVSSSPPANPEAEAGFLVHAFTRPDLLDRPEAVALLPGDFFDPAYRVIHRHLVGAQVSGQSPEVLPARIRAAGEYTDDVHAALTKIAAAPGSGNDVAHFASIIKETAEQRKLWELHQELGQQIRDNLPATDIRDFFSAALDSTATKTEVVKPMDKLREIWKSLRPPVIHGLVRRGETLNVIAPPKAGKSWLVTDMGLSICTGRPWQGFGTSQGDVLIVDNELHVETSVHRTQTVAEARGITIDQYGNHLFIENVRGRLKDIHAMASFFAQFKAGQFRVVILDALYRFLPAGVSENDNASMAQVYNAIDTYAAKLDCCFVCIHHSTKGNQSGKSVVDTGAGAGAQSRAADCHLVLRAHEQDHCVVLDAAVRSFQPIDPIVLRWTFPVWNLAPELDPTALRPDKPPRKKKPEADDAPKEQPWTAERFAAAFITDKPQPRLAIIDAAVAGGLSDRKADSLLKRAAATKLAHPWTDPTDARKVLYATVKQPEEVAQ